MKQVLESPPSYLHALALGGAGVTAGVASYYLWRWWKGDGDAAFVYTPTNPQRVEIATSGDAQLEVHITGFGKFHGVPSNPTTVLASSIASFLDAHPLEHSTHATLKSAEVLETSAVGSLMQLATLRAKVRTTSDGDGPFKQHLWLHFGVNARSTKFAVEKVCYNEANFRCPDERNWCAVDQPIDPEDGSTTFQRHTSLDVDSIVGRLEKKGHAVCSSTDPGRYICNWVYFHSLRLNDFDPTVCSSSLFVHVPPFSEISEQHQLRFVRDLLDTIAELNMPEKHGASLD